MVKKIGDKKISRVDPTDVTKEVDPTKGVGGITPVKPTGAVGTTRAVSGAGKRRATRVMTLAEREELFRMVSEEAKKIFPQGTLPQEKREIIEGAVKMAIDSVLEEDQESKKS